jgi:hypothetical protein
VFACAVTQWTYIPACWPQLNAATLGLHTTAGELQAAVPRSHVYKAFTMVGAELMVGGGIRHSHWRSGGRSPLPCFSACWPG